MREAKVIRNKAIVVLHQNDPQLFTFGVLAKLLGLKRNVAHKVFHRDKALYSGSQEKQANINK